MNTNMNSTSNSSLVRAVPWLAALTAVVWVIVSVSLFFADSNMRLDSPARYWENGSFLVGLIAVGLALSAIQRGYGLAAGRLEQASYWIVILGLALHMIQDTASLIVGTDAVLNPIYPIAMVVSWLGFLVWGIAVYRHSLLPRWIGPVLALAWIIGTLGSMSSAAACLVIPLAWAGAALALRRPATAREVAPAM